MKLNSEALGRLDPPVEVPRYDRTGIEVGIVHVGVGGFHRAHQAMYLDRLMNMGLALDWGICGTGLLPADAAMRDALQTVDRSRRKADYAFVQRAIARDLPIFPLWQVRIPDAYRAYVHGIAPAPFGSTFWNAWSWSVESP